ncbi:MAG: PAS domain S-box protein [Bacteroidales bacterium]|nr:MAG: PAS domain S-box protein [Bacteroidales bacterium]
MRLLFSFENSLKIQGLLIFLIGMLGFLGWASNALLLASYSDNFIPMAPDTSFIFLIFGLVLFTNSYKSHIPIIRTGTIITIAFLTFYGFFKSVEYFANSDLTFEYYLSPVTEKWGAFPLKRMSPLTGFLFFMAGIAFLVKAKFGEKKSTNGLIGILGASVTFSGFAVILGYLFQTPLLYKSGVIPLALPTAICFLILGVSIVIYSGRKNFIVRQFIGRTPYNILIRSIIPILFFAILFQGLILKYFNDSKTLNFALFSALLTLLLITLIGFVIIQVSKSVFKNAILAENKRKQAEIAVQSKDELLKLTGESANVGGWEYDVQTQQITISSEIARILGLDTKQNLKVFEDSLMQDSRKIYDNAIELIIKKRIASDFEVDIITNEGQQRNLRIIGIPVVEDSSVEKIRGIIHDITGEKNYDKKQLLIANILALLNRPIEWGLLVDDILYGIKEYLKNESIVLQVQGKNDNPFNHSIGFPDKYDISKNTLCPRRDNCDIVNEQECNSFYECFCDVVIKGNSKTANHNFTALSSFWFNTLDSLNAYVPKSDLPHHFRNHCNLNAYESVALIPLHSDDEIIGFLQLNDKRPNFFNTDIIGFMEELSSLIGIAFKRIQSENKIKENEKKFRAMFESAAVGVALIDTNNWKPIEINQKYCDILGYSMDEMLSISPMEITHENDIEENLKQRNRIVNGEISEYSIVKRYYHKNGSIVWVNLFVSLMADSERFQNYHIVIVEDITAQRITEKALTDSEEHFRSIAQTAGDAIISMNEEGKIFTWNNAASTIFGHSESEVLGVDFKNLIIPIEYSNIISNCFQRVNQEPIENSSGNTIEIKAFRKDGVVIPVELSISSYKKDNKWHATAILRDISKRKEAEKEIKERVKEIQCLQNITRIIDKDSLTFAKFFNKVANLIPTGFQYPENTECRIVLKDHTFQTSTFVESNLRLSSEIVNKNKQLGYIEVFLHYEANEPSFTPFLTEEKELITTISKILSEFIERKRKEQIQKIIYNSSIAVDTSESLADLIDYIKNQIGLLIDTTNFFAAFYDEETDTITLPYHNDQKDIIKHFPAGRTLTKHVIRTKKPLLVNKKQIEELENAGTIDSFGNKAAVWLGVPLIVKGKITGIFAVQSHEDRNAYDNDDLEMLEFISRQVSILIERKKVEQDMKIAFEKAKESDRLKSTFLATMSHELRTPLNAVIGFSDMMKNEIDNTKIPEYAGIINTCGLNLLEIVEDIFDITLLESGEVKVSLEDYRISNLPHDINDSIVLEQEKLNKQHLSITFIPPQEIDNLILHTDKTKLKQILLNLIKNALKFTFKGYIEYGLSIDEIDDNSVIKFYVKDTGIGISEEHIEIIFENFRQVDDSNTRLFGGTGLGLSVARRYTEMLGGKIWVESNFGKGSTFYFTLPNYELLAVDENIKYKDTLSAMLNFKGKTILIAEDETSNYELLVVYLEHLEVKILWARNGEEAITICNTIGGIDLVLMDIKMPKINGFDATISIKKTHPNLPIIAQTAFVLHGDDRKALEAGCDDYISKPIKRRELYGLLSKYLQE